MTRRRAFEDVTDDWDEGSWRRVYVNQHVDPSIEEVESDEGAH